MEEVVGRRSSRRKITLEPAGITGKDVADLRKHSTVSQVAELVHHAASAAMINRIGEACGLTLEES